MADGLVPFAEGPEQELFCFDRKAETRGEDEGELPVYVWRNGEARLAAPTFAHWLDESHAWGGYKYLVGSVLYGGAGLIAASRVYNNKHWTSDVVTGALVGTFSGLKTVEYNYRHPNNRVERWLVKLEIIPGQGHIPTWVGFSLSPTFEPAIPH